MRKQQSFLLSCKDGWYQEGELCELACRNMTLTDMGLASIRDTADGGNKYYGKRCLIRMGSGTGLCLGVVDINDPRTLGKGECPDINADDISPNYVSGLLRQSCDWKSDVEVPFPISMTCSDKQLWNLQAVAEQM